MKIKARHIVLIAVSILIVITSLLSWHSSIATYIRQGKRINGLIVGTDWVDYAQHSDTIIFVSYDPKTQFLDIISVPRDTKITLPDIRVRRINQIYAYYYKKDKNHYTASEALTKILTILFNNRIEITHFLQTDYDTFCESIDIIGKIKIDIQEPMHYDNRAGKLHIHFATGTFLLDGKKALKYVRYRGPAGDIGRIYRQQRFIKAIAKRISSPLFIFRLPKLTSLMLRKLHTNLSLWDMINLLIELRHIKLENIRMAQLPGRPRGPVWLVNETELDHAIDMIIGPEVLTDQEEIPTVEVLNASPYNGVALDVTRKLRDINFDVIDYRNYPTRQKKTIVIDRVGNLRAAQKIARLLNTEEIFTRYDSKRMVDISVIIGEDYR